VIRFGPFEANPQTRELTKHGRRIRLPGLPFEVLLALLDAPGALVTRETLHKRLWKDDTFVDFDNNLNAAVNRLRQTLGDSAEKPQYIETLPRLGYRFIGAVTRGASSVPLEPEPTASAAPDPQTAATPDGLSRQTAVAAPAAPTVFHDKDRPAKVRILAVLGTAAVLLLFAAFASTRLWSGGTSAAPVRTLTLLVLPFENLTGDADQGYVSDGITEEMITELARVAPAKLAVIARTTAFKYKATTKSVTEIAREVQADYVLEGSVRRDGTTVRVTAQLIEAVNQRHTWAASYDRDMRGLLDMERDVASAVAAAVRVAVVPPADAVAATSVSEDARDAYLRARYFASRGTVFGVEKAIEYFRQATALEPGYALAHAGLARALVFATQTEPGSALRQAKAAAADARRLQPALPEAALAWAMTTLYTDRDLVAADAAFQQALALDEGNAEAHFYYAQALTARGRFDEALAAARRAQALDPFSPLIHHYVGRVLHFAGRNRDAIDHFAKTLDLEPNYPWALLFTANAWEDLGDFAQATAARQKYWTAMNVPPDKVKALGDRFAADGYAAVRREWIAWIEGFVKTSGFVTSTELAMLYGGLGDKDAAFTWLSRAVDDHTRDLIYLKVTPELKPLRDDPRFDAILARVLPRPST
jgi:TolB-like protein/DNA-binding winged helix-turn-helix (wHTH) protein/Tfp pilus assembly protein PilF